MSGDLRYMPDGRELPRRCRRLGLIALLGVLVASVLIGTPAHGAFPGDNGRIVFERDFDIYTMDPDGGNLARLTDDGGADDAYDGSPVWSAYGTKIAYVTGSRFGERDIFTMDADGANKVNVTNSPTSIETNPGFSPDGSTLVFSSNRDAPEDAPSFPQPYDLYTINADGTGTSTRLTDEPGMERDPSFSPDGTTVVYSSIARNENGQTQWEVLTVDVAGGADPTKVVIEVPLRDPVPDLSPDGTRLTFIGDTNAGDVYVQNLDGTGLTAITSDDATTRNFDANPAFSPDGGRVTFSRSSANNTDVYTVSVAGTDEVNLTEGSRLFEDEPNWGVEEDFGPSSSSTFTSAPSSSTSSTSFTSTSIATSSTSSSTSISTSSTSTSTSSTSISVPPVEGTCDGLEPTITGSGMVIGTSGDDVILGSADDDVIVGGGGDDVICGGAGNDTLDGRAGDDRIFGDVGDDRLIGGAGIDLLDGGDGNDDLSGDAGDDHLLGGNGDDALRGGAGDDDSSGGGGNDRLTDGAGNDTLDGGADNDIIRGGGGNDALTGSDGDDRLLGEDGDDGLDGGDGTDRCSGGPGTNDVLGCETGGG